MLGDKKRPIQNLKSKSPLSQWEKADAALKMHALLFLTNSGLCGITSSTSPASSISRIYGREIADGALLLASQRTLLHPFCSSIRAEGNRRGRARRNIPSDGTEKAGKLKDLSTSDDDTPRPSGRDEIIELFRRIQYSISKGGSTVSRRRSQNSSREKKSAASVLGTIRQYQRKRQTEAQCVEEVKESLQSSAALENGATQDVKQSRPPSSFVKKSPIPPTSLKKNDKEVVDERASGIGTAAMFEVQKLDGMKLTELKEIAKTEGVKGYSKLKKGELLELLKGVMQSSS